MLSMKILILSNKPPWPSIDGGSAATASMIESLYQAGAEITVGSINTSKHRASKADLPQKLSSSVDYSLIPLDTTPRTPALICNLVFSSLPYNTSRFHFHEFEKYLTDVLEKQFDIIQIEGLAMLSYVDFIRKRSRARVVYRAHNIENEIWKQLSFESGSSARVLYYRILHKRLYRLEKQTPRVTDAVVTMTENDREWFVSNAELKSSIVIPAGFSPSDITVEPGDGRQLFFIGALDWEPNINGLRWFIDQVWPLVLKEATGTVFHISGRNPGKGLKEKLAGENIIFHGEVDSSTSFMKGKDILISPLFSGSGLRMKIIEAMSKGKCAIATPASVKGLKYTDGVDLFVAKTASEFADSIKMLCRDPLLRQKCGESAIKNVRENYDIFASAKRLINFYRQVI